MSKRTDVAVVLDDSWSMYHNGLGGTRSAPSEQPEALGRAVYKTLAQHKDGAGDVFVTLVPFSEYVSKPKRKPLSEGFPSDLRFRCGSATAVYDAVNEAIDALEPLDSRANNCAFLVIVISDGEDNASLTPPVNLGERIMRLEANGHWTFCHVSIGKNYSIEGIKPSNKVTVRSNKDVPKVGAAGVSRFMQARSEDRQAVDEGVLDEQDG